MSNCCLCTAPPRSAVLGKCCFASWDGVGGAAVNVDFYCEDQIGKSECEVRPLGTWYEGQGCASPSHAWWSPGFDIGGTRLSIMAHLPPLIEEIIQSEEFKGGNTPYNELTDSIYRAPGCQPNQVGPLNDDYINSIYCQECEDLITCFVKGSKVLMGDGSYKDIQDVSIGDAVKSLEENNNVIGLEKTILGSRKLVSLNGSKAFFSYDHPIYTENGLKSVNSEVATALYPHLDIVGDLEVGDIIITPNGPKSVESIDLVEDDPLTELYDLSLDGNSIYYVEDIAVHNCNILKCCNTETAECTDWYPSIGVNECLSFENPEYELVSNCALCVIPETWDCVGTLCIERDDGSGAYTSEEKCKEVCEVVADPIGACCKLSDTEVECIDILTEAQCDSFIIESDVLKTCWHEDGDCATETICEDCQQCTWRVEFQTYVVPDELVVFCDDTLADELGKTGMLSTTQECKDGDHGTLGCRDNYGNAWTDSSKGSPWKLIGSRGSFDDFSATSPFFYTGPCCNPRICINTEPQTRWEFKVYDSENNVIEHERGGYSLTAQCFGVDVPDGEPLCEGDCKWEFKEELVCENAVYKCQKDDDSTNDPDIGNWVLETPCSSDCSEGETLSGHGSFDISYSDLTSGATCETPPYPSIVEVNCEPSKEFPKWELINNCNGGFDGLRLPGDFNKDCVVDAADYNIWRDNLDEDSSVLNGNGVLYGGVAGLLVTNDDYILWQENFGETCGSICGCEDKEAPEISDACKGIGWVGIGNKIPGDGGYIDSDGIPRVDYPQVDSTSILNEAGYSASLSKDGTTVAIGAPGNRLKRGHVRVHRYSGSSWDMLGSDIDPGQNQDQFGESVSISSDGETVAIGAPLNDNDPTDSISKNHGYVRIMQYSNGLWVQKGQDIQSEVVRDSLVDSTGDFFGGIVSLSDNGNRVAISDSRFRGASSPLTDQTATYTVQIFEYKDDTSSWERIGSVDGAYGSLRPDGKMVAVKDMAGYRSVSDAPNLSVVRVYKFIPQATGDDTWEQVGDNIEYDAGLSTHDVFNSFGAALSLTGIEENGGVVAVGIPMDNLGSISDPLTQEENERGRAGRVQVFWNKDTGNWQKIGQDLDGTPYDLVGDAAGRTAPAKFVHFGHSVAINKVDDVITLVVGSDRTALSDPGVVRVFKYDSSISSLWTQHGSDLVGDYKKDKIFSNVSTNKTFVVPSTEGAFGYSVSISADSERIAVGIPRDDIEVVQLAPHFIGSTIVYGFDLSRDCSAEKALSPVSISCVKEPTGYRGACCYNKDGYPECVDVTEWGSQMTSTWCDRLGGEFSVGYSCDRITKAGGSCEPIGACCNAWVGHASSVLGGHTEPCENKPKSDCYLGIFYKSASCSDGYYANYNRTCSQKGACCHTNAPNKKYCVRRSNELDCAFWGGVFYPGDNATCEGCVTLATWDCSDRDAQGSQLDTPECILRDDGGGAYTSYEACLEVCEIAGACCTTSTGSCVYTTQNDCSETGKVFYKGKKCDDITCEPPTYNCVHSELFSGPSFCVDPQDGTGTYDGPDALLNCEDDCVQYECLDGVCEPFVGGSYDTSDCDNACTPTDTWICFENTCVDSGEAGKMEKEDCKNFCGTGTGACCLLTHYGGELCWNDQTYAMCTESYIIVDEGGSFVNWCVNTSCSTSPFGPCPC